MRGPIIAFGGNDRKRSCIRPSFGHIAPTDKRDAPTCARVFDRKAVCCVFHAVAGDCPVCLVGHRVVSVGIALERQIDAAVVTDCFCRKGRYRRARSVNDSTSPLPVPHRDRARRNFRQVRFTITERTARYAKGYGVGCSLLAQCGLPPTSRRLGYVALVAAIALQGRSLVTSPRG